MTSIALLLEDLVDADYGTADLATVRSLLGAHADALSPGAHARDFLEALSKVQRRKPAEVFVWAGTRLVAPITKLLPSLTKGHATTRTMLLQMSNSVSAVVAKLAPDLVCPEFWSDYLDRETVRISFDGPQEVAWLLEGVALGLGAHFRDQVTVSQAVAAPPLSERRLVDVRVIPERRLAQAKGGLSAAGLRS